MLHARDGRHCVAFELQTIGVMLMVIGGVGLVVTLGSFFMESRRERPSGSSRPLL